MGVQLAVGDRVMVQTTTTGTGTYQLGAALDGFLSLALSGIASGSRVPYVAVDDLVAPTQFEVGEGIYTAGVPVTLSRLLVWETHTGGNAAVNWGAGTKYVFVVPSAKRVAMLDTDGLLNPAWLVAGLQSQLRSAAAVNIGNNTVSVFPWDINDVDSLGLISGTPVGVLTIATDGVYRFQASLYFPPNPTGQRIMNLMVNGNTVRNQARALGNANVPAQLTVAWEAPLAAGTQARVDVIQDSGAVMAVGGGTQNNFTITRLR